MPPFQSKQQKPRQNDKRRSQSTEKAKVVHKWDKKFQDDVVDYFQEEKNDEQMFNKMPILKEYNKTMKAGKKQKALKQKQEELNSDDEFERMMLGGVTKKQKTQDDDVFGGQEGIFGQLTESFSNFFVTNKYALLQLEKVPILRYSVGTQVLTSVSEFGLAGQYLIANLSRNKKAFVTIPDSVEFASDESDMRLYDQGEYLIGEIVESVKQGNLNLSIKSSKLNNGLSLSDIVVNMVLVGIIISKEEHGAKIEIKGQEKLIGFLSKDECKDFDEIEEGRVYSFRVVKKEANKKLIQLSRILYNQENVDKYTVNVNLAEQDADLHHVAKPGNLVQCVVLKSLSNGLIVRFLKHFIGFVFEDHLEKDASSYREKEKHYARVIASDFEQKQINLSFKKVHLELETFNDHSIAVGDVLTNGFEVTKVLYGGSYFIKPLDSTIQSAFLHKTHAPSEEIKEGQKRTDHIKIKEINFFEHMPVITAKSELVKKVCSWNDLRPGQLLTGKIDKIISSPNGQFKIKVALNERMVGLVDFFNTSDLPKSGPIPKQFKEGRRIKVRVLSVNSAEKQLRLTLKQSFLIEEDAKLLKDVKDVIVGDSYVGYLSQKTEYGFIVQFFNNTIGLLTFKDIEVIHGNKRDEYRVGQSLRFHVTFVQIEQGKIGLSLSEKGLTHQQQQKQQINTSRNTLFKMEQLNAQLEQITHNIGDILQYTVEAHQAFNDVLTLHRDDHRAIIALEHLSDIKSNCYSLNSLYRTNANNNKQDIKIQCKIIQITQDKNVIVSCKQSLFSSSNPNSIEQVKPNKVYTGYIDRGARKGVIVKFNERIKLFIGQESTDGVVYSTYDSVLVYVKSVDKENKIIGSIIQEQVFKQPLTDVNRFISYFNEVSQLNKQHIQQEAKKQWNKFRIGDYTNTVIELIKDFGVVVKIADSQLTGLIMNEHVANIKATLQEGSQLLCRIIDVDFEKSMLDLIPSKLDESTNTKLGQLLFNHNFNIDKLLSQESNETSDLSVICQKGEYAICSLVKSPKVICLVNMSNFNGVVHEEMLYNQRIKNARLLNKQQLLKAQKNPQAVNVSDYSQYIPLYEQAVTSHNQSKNEQNEKGVVIKAGIKVVGKVLKKAGVNVFIQLKGKLYGKLHKAQCEDENEFNSFVEGQQIDCKILYVIRQDKQQLHIDLTTKKSHINSSGLDQTLLLPLDVTEFSNSSISKEYEGVIKSIDSTSIHPVYIELSNYHLGYLSAFQLPAETLNHLSTQFKKGQLVKVVINSLDEKQQKDQLKHIQISLADTKNIINSKGEVGDIVTAKVVKKNPAGLRVQISDKQFANVDVTEIADEWVGNPIDIYQENVFVTGRVILEEGGYKHLSLRNSVTSQENWNNALGPQGNTINYKKMFSDSEKIGDLRNRILKLGSGSLKIGMILVGYISNSSEKGCFLKIGQDTVVRAGLNELSDDHISKPQTEFTKNKLVVGRIISIREDGKIEASFRHSVIKHGFSMDESKLKAGVTVHGTVVGHYQGKASVQIRGCKYRASLDKDDTDFTDEEKMGYVEKLLPIGAQVKAKVVKYEKEPKIRIILSTEKSVFEKFGSNVQEEQIEEEKEQDSLDLLIKSVEEINKSATESKSQNEILINKSVSFKKKQEDKIEEEGDAADDENNEEKGEEEEDAEEDLDDEEVKKLIDQVNGKKLVIEGLDSDADENDDDGEDDENEGEDGEEEEEEDDDKEQDDDDILSEHSMLEEELGEEGIVTNKKKSKRQKEIEKRRKEEEIRKQELKIIDKDAQPETRDDYEKLILKNPNSSYLWIQFIAYVIEKEGIQAAREVTERSLRVINFSNETEKLNLWTAYLNLEHNFGEEKALVSVFERAKAQCKPKDIYFKLLEIYRRDLTHLDLLFQLSKNMSTKFKHSSKCWVEHLKNVILFREQMTEKKQEHKLNQSHDPKEVLKRALICLKKKKHIILLSQYAKLQYSHNQVETGRTTFEALLANYPKRTDIWNVYLDMEVKYGSVDSSRNLFNRVITMQFKQRQMKFFFRKFLQFEAARGSEEGVEAVKQKAAEFVRSLIGKEGEDDQEEVQDKNKTNKQESERMEVEDDDDEEEIDEELQDEE